MKGLLLALGAKKGPMSDEDDGEESPPSSKGEEAPERMYAREAYSASKEGDEDGFIEAFISAIKACKSKSYEADEDEG